MTDGGGQKPEPPPVFVFAAVFFISFFFVLFLETSHDNKLHSQTEAQTSADALAATSMGKKSRRDRAGNRDPTMHPSQGLQKATRRHHPDADIGDTFLPLTEIPASLESSQPAEFMRGLIEVGTLRNWEAGMCKQHIATRAHTGSGLVDLLVSPDPTDRNWTGLVTAQLDRLAMLCIDPTHETRLKEVVFSS